MKGRIIAIIGRYASLGTCSSDNPAKVVFLLSGFECSRLERYNLRRFLVINGL